MIESSEESERGLQQMARRTREETKERSIFRELGGWLLYILIIIGLTYLIITFVGQRTRVSGSSMETTLSNGDNLIVDKLTYHFRSRSGMILSYFLINMRKIHTISSASSDFLERRSR